MTPLGILHLPLQRGREPGLPGTYRGAVAYKANPRTAEYMEHLFRRRRPDGDVLPTSDPAWRQRIAEADELVLLYPDAIGLGFLGIERVIRRSVPSPPTVITGRGREFALDSRTHRQLLARRALEWTMLFELAVATPVFVVATPLLWLVDLVRGRR